MGLYKHKVFDSSQKQERLMNRTKVIQPERDGNEADSVCIAMLCTNEKSKNMAKHVDFKIRQNWVQTQL